MKNPPPRPFPWFWVAVAVTLLSVAGYGTQFYIRWQRNRYRVTPSEVIHLQEGGKQATILDVRRAEAYEALPLKIPGSVRLAPEELETGISGLELDTTHPSSRIAPHRRGDQRQGRPEAQGVGFKDVRILKGGLGAWTNAGLPIESRSDLSRSA